MELSLIALLVTSFAVCTYGQEIEEEVRNKVEAEWADVVACFRLLTSQTSFPTISPSSDVKAAELTRDIFKSICGTKEQFLSCVDDSLNKTEGHTMIQLFRPLFNLSMVTEAYNDLCENLTVAQNDAEFSCLLNSTALTPCYTEYYNYLFYLSVVKRFGSPKRQLSDEVVNTLLCTLAEERRDCEVAALSTCSTKISEVMQAFYRKTLPSLCSEQEKQDNKPQKTPESKPVDETQEKTTRTPPIAANGTA